MGKAIGEELKESKESRLTEQIARLEEEKQRLAESLYQSQMSELGALRKLEAAREAMGRMRGRAEVDGGAEIEIGDPGEPDDG